MVDFWENHFSIFANKDADRWLLTGFDRDTIRPFALGRFRDLLGATAHSPAMLYYLDNWQSSVRHDIPATKDKPARSYGGINENYARDLMELHTLGVDGGYTQADVQEVARCFTGWTIKQSFWGGTFQYAPDRHDAGDKRVLGEAIRGRGGAAGEEEGNQVLRVLARQPATAHYVAPRLCRRFIADDPPPAAVKQVAHAFQASDGHVAAALRALFGSPAFLGSTRGKFKRPFEFVVSAL